MFLHVEASPDMTLREAHEYVVMFEKALGKRLNTTRIETHIEPGRSPLRSGKRPALRRGSPLCARRRGQHTPGISDGVQCARPAPDAYGRDAAGQLPLASSTAICPLPPPTMSPRTWNAASAPAHPSSTASSSIPTRPPLSSCLRRDSGACLNLFGKDERQTTKNGGRRNVLRFSHSGKLGAGIQ